MSAHGPATPVRGAPCWVSLMARDLDSAQEFYSAVLGWRFRPASLGEEFSVAVGAGQAVAGIGALAQSFQVAVAWTSYFAVENADETADRIRERGGPSRSARSSSVPGAPPSPPIPTAPRSASGRARPWRGRSAGVPRPP